MPYERKGKCVYLKTTGKKVGCSSSVEKAKKYIMALHANVHENFDSYVEHLLEANAYGLIGFTSNEGTAYSYVYNKGTSHQSMIEKLVPVSGNRGVIPNPRLAELDQPDLLQWRYNFKSDLVYIWQGSQPKSNLTLNHLAAFFANKGWPVAGFKYLSSEKNDAFNKDFHDSHFLN